MTTTEILGGDIGALAAAISLAARDVGVVAKGGENAHDRYRYARDADLLRSLVPALAAHGLALVVVDMQAEYHDTGTTTRSGTPIQECRIEATYRILHQGGGWVQVRSVGAGRDHGDKASYKAMTGAYKYAIRQAFAVTTGDDAEVYSEATGDDVRPAKRAAPKRTKAAPTWTDAQRDDFRAQLDEAIGPDLDVDEVAPMLAAWCERNGRPRPAAMTPDQRAKMLVWIATDAGRQAVGLRVPGEDGEE